MNSRQTRLAGWLLCAAGMAFCPSLRAQSQPSDPRAAALHAKLERQLEQMAAEFDGVMGIVVKDLTSGESFQVNAEMVFPQASSIKLAILTELFRQAQVGGLRLEERVEVKRGQMVGGSGVLQHFGDVSSALSLRDLAVLMIVLSDNTATNLMIDRLGMDNVNQMLRKLGLEQTRLQRKMMDQESRRAGRENLSTPREMTTLLERLERGQVLDASHTAALMDILQYPKEGPTPLGRGLPEGVALASKDGTLPGVRCESGIVRLPGRPYVIAVMTTYGSRQDSAERAISEVSRRVFVYFERLAHSNAHGARSP